MFLGAALVNSCSHPGLKHLSGQSMTTSLTFQIQISNALKPPIQNSGFKGDISPQDVLPASLMVFGNHHGK